ncbi:MAG: exopolyphosphatase [Deltaproteobacteria bacterium]|nr:exopolyphosphatase [Deltaproteobacteria bacterium]
MRLLTRSDFDGLISAVLLKEAGIMDEWKFVHPKDVQDGLIEVTPQDILANVPYAPGCGLWFDHHSSEQERLGRDFAFEGASEPLPSCARVIWQYYGGHRTFAPRFDEMLTYVDRCDSAQLSLDEVKEPRGWVLLSFVMDPRTGLGRYRDYRISNYQLMEELVEWCRTMPVEEILRQPDVAERVARYFAQEGLFRGMLAQHSRAQGNCVVIDLREVAEIFTGNRFTVYTMYPECNISMQVIWGKQQQNVVFTVGHSIFNRTSRTNVGSLMLAYGGGGHAKVGTCQVATADAARVLDELLQKINQDG